MAVMRVYTGGQWVDVLPAAQVALYSQPTPPSDTSGMWADTSVTGTYGVSVLTTAQRNALSGVTRGRTIFNADTGGIEVYYGATTGWRPPWNVAWGEVSYDQTVVTPALSTTAVDVIVSTATPWPANRKLRVFAIVQEGTTVSATNSEVFAQITNAANGVLGQTRWFNPTANTKAMPSHLAEVRVVWGGGNVQFKFRISLQTGTGQTYVTASDPIFIVVEDNGPSGNAPAS